MEGLEIAEVSFSYALANNEVFRFDSNYFQKEYLNEERILRRKGGVRICEAGAQVKSFGAYSLNNAVEYLDSGIPFIRGVNMKKGRVNFSDMQFISKEAHELLWKSEVKEGMVLLSMSGTIGDVAIATLKWTYPVNSNQDIAKIDTQGRINPFILYAFLMSRYGQNYLQREARGSVQQHVFLSQIEQIELPTFDLKFGSAIQQVIEKSEHCQTMADDKVREAESTLLAALKLDRWTPPTPLSYVRSSNDAFTSGRLDAEHFQVQYDDIEQKIKRNQHGHTTIGKLAHDLMNGAEVREYQDKGVAYLRVGDLKNLDIDPNSVVRIDPVSAEKGLDKIALRKGDVLVSRSGSLAVTAVVEPEWEDALISSHLIRLRIEDERIDPYFLALFLSTLPGKKQIIKWSNGGVQPEISQPSLSNVLVPVLEAKIQQEIRKNILLSREERQKAESLLDAAKRTVEIAIEDSEAAALAYLQGVV